MVSRGVFYGVVVVLVALSLLTASVAALYYFQYQNQSSQTQKYESELALTLTRYHTISTTERASLKDLNSTISLLSEALANLNTSSTAYLAGSQALASLWNDYLKQSRTAGAASISYVAHMLIEFVNGSRIWSNSTRVQPGWNAYTYTVVALNGSVQATWYPSFQEHFVVGLVGVSATGSNAWFVWNYTGGRWLALSTGSNGLQLHNGTSFAWTLCGYDQNFNPNCSP